MRRATLRLRAVEFRFKYARRLLLALGWERYSLHVVLWPLHLEVAFL